MVSAWSTVSDEAVASPRKAAANRSLATCGWSVLPSKKSIVTSNAFASFTRLSADGFWRTPVSKWLIMAAGTFECLDRSSCVQPRASRSARSRFPKSVGSGIDSQYEML